MLCERFMSNRKKIPVFRIEAEERKFWETHDSTDYIDWSNAKHVQFPNLKLSAKSILSRLFGSLLNVGASLFLIRKNIISD